MLKITVENITEQDFLFLINKSTLPSTGEDFLLPCNITATNISLSGSKFTANPIFNFILEVVGGVAANILSTYLYEKLVEINKNKKAVLKINDSNTPIDESAMKAKIIQSAIPSKSKDGARDGTE